MDPDKCNSFESNSTNQQEQNVAKNLADVAEAHEQSLKLFRESFDLESSGKEPLTNEAKKKHKKSKRYCNP